MNWSNVRLIFCREVRDQLRDRRTLFMIAVLPLLLYPLLGMSLFQVALFVREQPTKVFLLGKSSLPESPALLDGGRFAVRLFSEPEKARLLELSFPEEGAVVPTDEKALAALASKLVDDGEYEAVVVVPHDFDAELQAFRQNLAVQAGNNASGKPADAAPKVPSPQVFYNAAKEKSQLAFLRVSRVVDRWTEEIGRENLASRHVPENAMRPFELAEHNVADEGQREAAVWSKILPFMLLIWALTGAFYPAVDLCAGEKERGTLETLLSSPAARSEIVWGKLFTIMLFSVATSVLNIASIGVTGLAVSTQLPEIGPPPPLAPLWLLVALVPMAALFSALCLALAAFARSNKEGQYYLMPLVLVTMPLVMLPMAPGVELSLGNSLIPVTGVVLLLRSLLEGEYLQALPYVAPVVAVTAAGCLLAVRWAIDQFNSESVLFRESERLDVGLWLKHLMRDREDTPSVAAAVFCGVLILVVRFFMSVAAETPTTFTQLAVTSLVTQLVVIATPTLLMTIMLTRSPRKTLLLKLPPLASLPAAVVLAVLLQPTVNWLSTVVMKLYPVNLEMAKQLSDLFEGAPNVWLLILLFAVVPAVFEELAFRGFILSGFRHVGHKWRAIALSSFLFGITHGMLQQSIMACFSGMVIGYLAVQTGSLLPCILYHVTNNSLALLATRVTPQMLADYPALRWLAEPNAEQGLAFTWPAIVCGLLLAAGILVWFRSLPYRRTPEEALQEAIDHQSAQAPAA